MPKHRRAIAPILLHDHRLICVYIHDGHPVGAPLSAAGESTVHSVASWAAGFRMRQAARRFTWQDPITSAMAGCR